MKSHVYFFKVLVCLLEFMVKCRREMDERFGYQKWSEERHRGELAVWFSDDVELGIYK